MLTATCVQPFFSSMVIDHVWICSFIRKKNDVYGALNWLVIHLAFIFL